MGPIEPAKEDTDALGNGLYFRKWALSASGWMRFTALFAIPNMCALWCLFKLVLDSDGILAFGPPLPFDLTVRERDGLTLVCFIGVYLSIGGLVIFMMRRMGTFVSGIRIHDGRFDMICKRGTILASIPATCVTRVQAVQNFLSERKVVRITLHDADGRGYTLRNSMDKTSLDSLAELCRYANIRYQYQKDVYEPATLSLLMALFAEIFFAFRPDHPFPAAFSAVALMSFFQIICHRIVVRNMK